MIIISATLDFANQMYLISAHEPVYSSEGLPRETFFGGSA